MEPAQNTNPESSDQKFRVQLDPLDLARALEETGRYRRDTRLGGILHGRKLSVREVAPEDSVHLVMEGNRLHAHVDRYSPLNCAGRRKRQYSLPAVVVHNVADVIANGFRALVGRHRDHCEFTCERTWVDDDEAPVITVETDGGAVSAVSAESGQVVGVEGDAVVVTIDTEGPSTGHK